MSLDFSQCVYQPYQHQKEGIELLVNNPKFGLFDDMRLGKSLQTIVTSQILYSRGEIDKVLIVCPNGVRGVWFDKELGELKKHLWPNLSASITEFRQRNRTWLHGPESDKRLKFLITNFEFIRSKARQLQLLSYCTQKTLMVIDEATAVKNSTSQQTKACVALSRDCGRIILLTGTPITNSIGDLYSYGNILNPKILGCKSFTHFRARYAVMGGYRIGGRPVQIIGWTNIEDIQERFKPYVLRRLKEDVLKDLPPKIPPIILTATMTDETWKLYKSMKDDLVAWLSDSEVSAAQQAVTKIIRLQQLTSGFLGGIEGGISLDDNTREIGREKLDLVLNWIEQRVAENPKFRLVIWCRFRHELKRIVKELSEKYTNVAFIAGNQKREDREYALRLLDPRTVPDDGPVFVVGNPSSGGMGISLVAADHVMYLSNSHDLTERLQSEDRTIGPLQKNACFYADVLMETPSGGPTIDHTIIKALRKKEDLADYTAAAWIKELESE